MRVLFVTSSLSYGGAAKILIFVANGLSKKGHQVSVVNLLEVYDETQQLSENIIVHRIKTHRIKYIDKMETIIKLRRCITKEKPDVIVAFKSTPTWLSCMANSFTNIPIIFSERGDPYRENLKRIRTYMYWKMINGVSGAVFQTYGAKKCYEESLRRRSVVIPNPVFKVLESGEKQNEKAIVSFGRLENYQKRYDVMIEAFGVFHQTHRDYKLKIYGTGDDEELLKDWVMEKKLQDVVDFMGYTGEPSKLLKNGNIFLITSDFEGISNALLEAMAAGYPVISTDSTPGGARMLIHNRINGLLVPAGNSKRVAEALSEFADNELLRNECANNARSVIERFSSERILKQWEMYITKIANTK